VIGNSFTHPALEVARRCEQPDVLTSARSLSGIYMRKIASRNKEIDDYFKSLILPDSLKKEVRDQLEQNLAAGAAIESDFVEDISSTDEGRVHEALIELGNLEQMSLAAIRKILERLDTWKSQGLFLTGAVTLLKAPPTIAKDVVRKLLPFIDFKRRSQDPSSTATSVLTKISLRSEPAVDEIVLTSSAEDGELRAPGFLILSHVAQQGPRVLFDALARHPLEGQAVILRALAGSIDPTKKRYYNAFIHSNYESGLPTILTYTKSEDPKVREAAVMIIGQARLFNLDADRHLNSWAESGPPDLRRIAIRAYGLVPDDRGDAIPLLLPVLAEDEGEARTEAVIALGRIGWVQEAARQALIAHVAERAGEVEELALVESLEALYDKLGPRDVAAAALSEPAKAIFETGRSEESRKLAMGVLLQVHSGRPEIVLPVLRERREKASETERAWIDVAIRSLEESR